MVECAPNVQIQPLGTDLVHRIAAGEVIDSLGAVVRELLDNALDAEADRISISLWPQDWRVQVVDNGQGLTVADLTQAATPHTTSKLQREEDLWDIHTLGFRGEALHSLAQMGRLEICSRPLGSAQGCRVQYDHQGHGVAQETVAIATGTVVTVSELFQDWPTRKQALPDPARQMRAVQTIIHDHALCHPQVTWQVQQNNRPWFSIAPAEVAQDILSQLLATLHPGDLCHHRFQVPELPGDNSVEVVLGLPDRCHRHRPDWVKVAVNGRCVQVSGEDAGQSHPIEQTILAAFRQTLPRHRHPLCFIHLHADPQHVDWHRHPAKTEIYLRHLDQWRPAITTTIQEALQIPADVRDTGHTQKIRQLMKVAEAKGVYHLQQPSLLSPQADPRDSSFNVLHAIAQLHRTYIVAEHPSGVWLVEQHIAHERVLYEQLGQDWQFVPLTPPLMLRDLSERQVEQLTDIGIDIAEFGHQLWAIRSAPQRLAERSDCEAALIELSQCESIEAALAATACRSAIRNGMTLNLLEMQNLLDQWQQTRHPRTCPHGRPIYLSMEEADLSRFFRRHWVIGKSHGI
ncbi:DNA mismatch repair endonuclease MutL [Acaryochloris sp. IP29b_bin.137]|uniref:DNA mismatch repair endonuclease MutL n=1 Tax=Acaryochloris sp. IP29b_bin.137 TaxID=2969217 RepID=UPI002616AEC5|nr:DNA mismatch repair endonuclease MutL [Acaryochloris sp. IP29b_bin.137]